MPVLGWLVSSIQAGLSTVYVSHKARYSVFVFFCPCSGSISEGEVLTKHCYFTVRQAAFPDFAELHGV